MQQQQMPTPQFKFEGGHLVMYHPASTGLPQTRDSNVNDRDRMQDLLSTEKYLTNSYDTFMNEASHDALFQVIKQNHSKCQDMQRQIFNTMFAKGWYKLAVADAQSVSDAYNKAVQSKSQFPFPSNLGQQQTGAQAPHISITQAMQQAQQQQAQQQQAQQQQTQMTQPPTQTVSDSPTKSRSQAQTVSPVQSFTPAQQQAATQVQTQVHSTGTTQQH
ncbi:MAG TPA: spore coat protein [Symbiobacteriaceae bacterium]|nr:spore coat protein [Symbiobacteriaceae bacterium]